MAVELSVIVPSYGLGENLSACLRSLSEQKTNLEYEIIVVDSSTDTGDEAIEKQFPHVRLIRSQTRLFPGGARNLGVRHAAANRLAFIDSDCIATTTWIRSAFQAIENGHTFTSGPVLDVYPIQPISWVDNRCQFADFQRGRPAGRIKHVPGCNLVFTKETWKVMNGFNEKFVTGEDGLIGAGFPGREPEMWFDPELVVHHHGRNNLRGFLQHQDTLGYHRGLLGLSVSASLEKIGWNPLLAWTMIPRRLVYFGLRTIQYNKGGLLRFILSTPLFLIGLTAWTIGFHRGVKRRLNRP